MMTLATLAEESTRRIGSVLGSRWVQRIRVFEAPVQRAASTNWEVFRVSTCERTTRAMPGQVARVSAITTLTPLVPSTETTTIARTSAGNDWNVSTSRCASKSTVPPRKPLTPPTMAAMMVAISTVVKLIDTVIRVP